MDLLNVFRTTSSGSVLGRRARGAAVIAQDAIRSEDPATPNHANRLIWADAFLADPESEGDRLWAQLLQNATVLDALDVLRRVHPEAERLLPKNGAVADYFRFSINGGDVTTSLHHPLVEGDHLILFSATVGG